MTKFIHGKNKVIKLLDAIPEMIWVPYRQLLDVRSAPLLAVERGRDGDGMGAVAHEKRPPYVGLGKTLEARTRRRKVAQGVTRVDLIDDGEQELVY